MPVPTPGDNLIASLRTSGTQIVAHLAKAYTFDPEGPATLPQITECDFPGYAPVVITDWEDVRPGDPDVAEVLSAMLHFEADETITTPQQAVLFYVTGEKTGVAIVIMDLEIFSHPFIFAYPGDFIDRQTRVLEPVNSGPSLVE